MVTDLVTFDHPQARQVAKMLEPLADRFRDALGGVLSERRLMSSVMIAMDRNRDLFKCDPQSIVMTAMSAAVVGLEPDGVLGQSFLIPFNVKSRGLCAQFMTGYKGFVSLAARGSFSVRGDVIRKGDIFEFSKADGVVDHRPKLGSNGDIIGAWALAASKLLPNVVEVVDIAELLEIRSRAKNAASGFSPWLDPKVGYPAMCAKTAKRRLARSLPFGRVPQFGIAAAIDESVDERGLPAWATPEGGVQVGSQGRSEPFIANVQPPINVTPDGSGEWPELTPDLARRAGLMSESIATATTVRQLDGRWNHVKAGPLKDQIRIMSEKALDRLSERYEKKRMELSEIEESNG